MAKNTERLDLYMKEPEVDGNDTFNITTMLNNNWDKIDKKVAMVDENGKVVNKDGTPTSEVLSVNDKKGNVQLDKEDVGLKNVDNVKQASKTEFDSHNSDTTKHITAAERNKWNNKVDKVSGKSLSTNDYTTTEKNKLAGIAVGANNYSHPSSHPASMITESSTRRFVTDTEKSNWNAKETPSGAQAKVDEKFDSLSFSIGLYSVIPTGESGSVSVGAFSACRGSNSVALGIATEANNSNEGVLGGSNSSVPNKWLVPGSFTVNGTKNFEMPHPHPDKRDTHRLRHSAVESPTAGDNLYRFSIEANQDNETVELELPDYFRYLNKNVDVWVNGVDHFGNAYGKVEGNTLKVNCEYAGKYNVLVIGTRNDDHQSVQNWDIKGVEREVGESWTGETYVFEVDEILEVEEIREEDIA